MIDYNKCSQEEINTEFKKSCKSGGDIRALLHILNHFNKQPDNWYEGLISACESGHLSVVKHLVKLPHLNEQKNIDLAFTSACFGGKIDFVKYLLTSNDLKYNADIHDKNDLGLRTACFAGHLHVVSYLLTSPDLKEHADIHGDNSSPIIGSCKEGHLDMVQYLLTSTELKEHANIHAREDQAFISAYKIGKPENYEVIEYLLFDYGIEKTRHIENFFNSIGEGQSILKMFDNRDLEKSLQNKLAPKLGRTSKRKI